MQQRSNAIGLSVRLFVISAIGWLVVSAVDAQSASAHAIAEPVDGWGLTKRLIMAAGLKMVTIGGEGRLTMIIILGIVGGDHFVLQ
jgi:hypothetical protein